MLQAKRILKIMFLSGCALLSACMVGPDYQPPSQKIPPAWNANTDAKASAAENRVLAHWWTVFNDPVLTDLMERIQVANLDWRQAQARLKSAHAERDLAEAQLFPSLSMSATVSKTDNSRLTGSGLTRELFSHSLIASWNPDIFGKLRRELEAADATLQATQADVRAVLVSLYADTALSYIEFRSLQTRLAVTESSLSAQQQTYQLTQWRYQAGLTSQLDAEQAKLNLESTAATLPSLRTELAQAEHHLSVLLGLAPGGLNSLLAKVQAIPFTPASIAVGIPADLLRQRPDVNRAERQLAAQTAQIGAAEAALYPDFTLTGSIGLESLAYTNLYTAAAKTFQIGANALVNVFDAGRIRKNIEIQTALQEQALALYEATLLQALAEVENALVAFAQQQTRHDKLQAAVEAAQNTLNLAQNQYQSGSADFLNVLDAQRSLLEFQQQLVLSTAENAANVIRLYKALGGGWQQHTSTEQKKS